MGAASVGKLMVKGVETEVAFHTAEGVFDTDEGDVESPKLLVFEFEGAA
jgi:hypothetical protein